MRRIHRDIVGTFIFSNDNHILLGKSRNGGVYNDQWLVPGGGIEPGETKLETAIRETLEEVGIDISRYAIKLLDKVLTGESEKILRNTGEKVMVDMAFYNFVIQAYKEADQIPINCTDDIVDAKWHPIDQLKKLNLSPPTKQTLRDLGYL